MPISVTTTAQASKSDTSSKKLSSSICSVICASIISGAFATPVRSEDYFWDTCSITELQTEEISYQKCYHDRFRALDGSHKVSTIFLENGKEISDKPDHPIWSPSGADCMINSYWKVCHFAR